MKKTLAALMIAPLIFTATAHAAAFTADQEAQVRELVRDTLVKNRKFWKKRLWRFSRNRPKNRPHR